VPHDSGLRLVPRTRWSYRHLDLASAGARWAVIAVFPTSKSRGALRRGAHGASRSAGLSPGTRKQVWWESHVLGRDR